jgi:hypothetical protein
VETALIDGDIAFREHSGVHTAFPNWPAFQEFAGHYIKGPASSPRRPPQTTNDRNMQLFNRNPLTL